MEPLDVIKCVSTCLIQSTIVAMVNPLSLEHPEDPFADGIVATVTNCANAAHQAVAAKISLIVAAGELTASI
jgi:hypothetical protein